MQPSTDRTEPLSAQRARRIALVQRSPACVAVHDRAAWLELFCTDAVVEDPVGSDPARKNDGSLGRFWDTFIAPHEIRFDVRADHFLGDDVMRDAIIHTRVRDGVEVQVPAYLLYQLEEQHGDLRVRRMAAHWALPAMSLTAMRMGPRAWIAMTGLFGRMTRVMGAHWVARYVASMWNGAGARGLQTLASLSGAVTARDESALAGLFTRDGGTCEVGDARASGNGLLALVPVGSTLVFEAPVTAGHTAAARFRIEGSAPAAGIVLLELEATDGRIRRARFFGG